jgi:NACHT domain
MAWVDGGDERCIFWLNGMAGTGKSTIARTVAYKYYNRNRLGASFFFSRGGGDVSHAGKFVTSIAAQLAGKSPSLKRSICEVITEYSAIASQALRDQWNQLVLQPLSKLEANSLQSPLLIVIDALDECEGENNIRMILQLLAEARAPRTVQLRIFLTSRPEIPIHFGFHTMPKILCYDLVLHDISRAIVDNDISTFFEQNLGIIKEECALPADWPGKQTITYLVQSAGGLFIWAATAYRFVRDGRQFAKDRLSRILKGDLAVKGPEGKLNEIYIAILTNSVHDGYDDQEKEKLYEMLKATLGTIAILFSSLSLVSLARLLHIPEEDIYGALYDLHSILVVPEDQDDSIRLHHPSFRDFLLDKQRCHDQRFWVDEEEAHRMLAVNCLRLMSEHLKRDICGLHSPGALATEVHGDQITKYLPKELQYACRYWVEHLQRSKARLSDNVQVHHFLKEHFLHWLEALALMGNISDGAVMLSVLESILMVSD